MSDQGLFFDRVSSLVAEIQQEKTAAMREKQGMKDPGGYEGPSDHPSAKSDDNELETAPEGEQSADNTKIVKEEIPDSVDQQPDATPSNVPSTDDTQLGQGVDKAKPTGEDPSTEEDYKGKPTGDKQEGDMGGTSHPADGSFGEKYSAEKLAGAKDDELLKMAADLGNEITADLANGHFSPAQADVTPEQAAAAGAGLAKAAEEIMPDQLAAAVIAHQIKVAHHQADLVANHLAWELSELQKAAEEEEDPLGGVAEGEDNGSEEIPADAGEELPVEGEELAEAGGGEGAEELLAAMGGGGEAMPPEVGGELAGMPEEALAGMDGDEGIQQLAMALLELGIDPAELAAAASDTGAKMASLVQQHKRTGKFRVEVPQNKTQKQARDYMRSYVLDLMRRNG